MHNKTKTNSERSQTMVSTINNRSTTERVGLETISKVVGESVLGKVKFSRGVTERVGKLFYTIWHKIV